MDWRRVPETLNTWMVSQRIADVDTRQGERGDEHDGRTIYVAVDCKTGPLNEEVKAEMVEALEEAIADHFGVPRFRWPEGGPPWDEKQG